MHIYKKGDKTDYCLSRHGNFINYLQNSTQHPVVKVNAICRKIIGDHQCGFWRNKSTTGQIFCIRQILDNEAVQ